jgi:hypothetical protein
VQGRKPGASLDTRKRLSVSPLKPGFKLRVEDVSGNIGQALVGGSPGLSLGGGGSPHTRSFGTSGAPSPIARAATTRAQRRTSTSFAKRQLAAPVLVGDRQKTHETSCHHRVGRHLIKETRFLFSSTYASSTFS